MTATLRVHAQFPIDSNSDTAKWKWVWIHCFDFPVDTLCELQFSSKPCKWVRFATGVVIGARGGLSRQRTKPDTPDVALLEYTMDGLRSLTTDIDLYYHVRDEDRPDMVPLDPNFANTGVSTTSRPSTPRDDFQRDVKARDGDYCVLSGAAEQFCDAVHLIARVKGSTYINAFTRSRHQLRGRNSDDVIEEIDDIRNGLFLNKFSHVGLGRDAAFLVTPNFAMEAEDLLYNGAPVQAQPQSRCTAHLFTHGQPLFLGGSPSILSGTAIRTPKDMSAWPPAVLFDAVYASAVFHHFGRPLKWKVAILAHWQKPCYIGEPMAARGCQLQGAEHRQNSKRGDCDRSDCGGPELNEPDFVLTLPFIGMQPEKMISIFEMRRAENIAKERGAVGAKVDSWLSGCPTS